MTAASAWLFVSSDRSGERAAAIYTLIGTAKLNEFDPQARLADVPRRIADHPASRLDELPPGIGNRLPLKPRCVT
jgi:transposase